MIKILWFSNCILSQTKNNASGSWLYSMSKLLSCSGEVYITNITIDSSVKSPVFIHISDNLDEYLIPNWSIKRNGLPSKKNCRLIEDLCCELAPNIIHVWGVENYFCHLVPFFNTRAKRLLEIQGLRNTCAKVYYGDLSIEDSFKCLGLREILLPFFLSIYSQKNRFVKYGKMDLKALKKYEYISTQSEWVRAQLMNHTKATIFRTRMSIRDEYLKQRIWTYPISNEVSLFWCSSSLFPYKSIQTAIKTVHLLKDDFPSIKLYVVGNIKPKRKFFINGYFKYIDKLIKKYNLVDNVIFTGSLYPSDMIKIMRKCVCSLQTSYVESYSLALAESMALGLPPVISYAGAMPELADDKVSGLFFSPGDFQTCAYKVKLLINDKEYAEKISSAAYSRARKLSSNEIVLDTQLNIYKDIIR